MPQPSDPTADNSLSFDDILETTKRAVERTTSEEAINKSLTKFSNSLQDGINELHETKARIADDFLTQERRIQKVEDKMDESKTQLIETLGLFVALFTFISVGFSIFQGLKPDVHGAISFMLLLGGLLIFFILLLHVIVRMGKDVWSKVTYFGLFIVAFSFIIIGLNFNGYFSKKTFEVTPAPTQFASPSATIKITPQSQ
ncbi:hypothetical protein KBC80_04240 [Candidatus Woesebacteria bacterium]|nr:hypothetical protein [Candidatus Woesebacteria bacterium]